MYESLILNEQFPPNDDEIKQLTHYARVKAGNKLEGLAPTRELFPPIGADVKPPRLSLWKHTKEGKDHVRRSRNIGNGNILNSGRVVGSDIRQASLATNQLVGMVEVDTGLETITFKFTSTSNGSKDNPFEVNLNVNMMDLLRKVQRWRDYERSTHERIFIVSKDESSLVSTFTKKTFRTFSLGDIIQMNNITNGNCLKIKTTIKEKTICDEGYLSL